MLILITYDVNTETAAGKTRLRKLQSNVSITAPGFRIPSLKVSWIIPSL